MSERVEKVIRRISTILVCSLVTVASLAQQYRVKAKCNVTESEIQLRWAPANYDSWRIGLQLGYIIERYTIVRGEEVLNPEEIAKLKYRSQEPIKVKPEEEWEPYSEEKYMAIAAECIYGEREKIEEITPFTAYKHHKENLQRYSFALYAADMSPQVAQYLGLAFSDKQINKEEKYLYKIFLNLPDTINQDTALVFANARVTSVLPNIQKPHVKWGDCSAEMSVDLTMINDTYTSYVWERSIDGGVTFTPVADNPTLTMTRNDDQLDILYQVDSLADNTTRYQYRVYGIDCFGRKGLPSEVVEGQGSMPLSAIPTLTRFEVKDNKRVELEWSFPEEQNGSIDGFRIYRQQGPKEHYKKIMEGTDPLQRTFVD